MNTQQLNEFCAGCNAMNGPAAPCRGTTAIAEMFSVLSKQLIAYTDPAELHSMAMEIRERSALLDYKKVLPRPAAEKEAIRRAVVHFKLKELYGDPPMHGGGVVIGETVEEILDDLRRRYGDRLLEAAP